MAEEKLIAVLNQGGAPHTTSKGLLKPQQSLELPEAEAERLCKYKTIVKASSVVPSVGNSEALKSENAGLRDKIAELEKQLGIRDEKVGDLTGRLQEFLKADKKDLKDLQATHAEAVPAAVEASEEPKK